MGIEERISAIGQRAKADPLVPLFDEVRAAQAADPENFISLAVGAPDPNVLPVEIARRLMDKVLDRGGEALNYTRPQGLPPFCQSFLARMQEQGISYDADKHDVLVTSGGMEAISMASEMLVDPGDTVLVESPAFAGALSVFELWGADIRHVPGDKYGMTAEALEEGIQAYGSKLVLVMPDGQNPGGTTMPLERRKEIARVLEKHGVYAIEDSAYSQLYYGEDRPPTLQSLSPDRVLLANSVSKFWFPAARLGLLLAPKREVSLAASIKSAYNMQASGFMQAVTAEYLSLDNPDMDEYLEGLLKTYAERRDAMDAALKEHFGDLPGFTWNKPEAGMFVWLEGPKKVDFTKRIKAAIENKVAYVPGSLFYADDHQGHNAARLNFASTPAEKIGPAIARLAATVRDS